MAQYTRRQFLEDSVLAAAVAAVLPAGSLLAGEKKKKAEPAAWRPTPCAAPTWA